MKITQEIMKVRKIKMKKIVNVLKHVIALPLTAIVVLLNAASFIVSFVALMIWSGYKEAINTVKQEKKEENNFEERLKL